MPLYQIDFSYKLPEWGSVELEADNVEQAEEFGLEYVKDTFEDIVDITIDGVKELK